MLGTKSLRFGAAILALGLVAAACGDDGDSATDTTAASGDSTATGGATCSGVEIGYLGALSGDNGQLGINMVNGGTIAVEEFNAANPNCQVKFDKDTWKDSQGDPAQATPLADQLANDSKIVAILGPGFSGETEATMPTFETAGLPAVSPSATRATLTTNGWKMFHRVLANDDVQGPGIVTLIKNNNPTKVGVIDDASAYGKPLADTVRTGLGTLKVADATIDPKAGDYSAAVSAMKTAGVDFIFYGGYYAEAGKLVKQLRDAGVTATFVSGDGSADPQFTTAAGDAGNGALLTSTGAPPDVNAAFATAFNAKFSKDPGLYSPESYDAVNIILKAIAAGKTDRAGIAEFISAFDGEGITKHLKFTATGEVEGSAVYWAKVEAGKLAWQGLIS